jgi:hypothetical protein
MSEPCIICVAITGSVPRKANNPAVPITISEQIDAMAKHLDDIQARADKYMKGKASGILTFGLKGGIGLQVLFFGLDFAYTYGLTDVAKEADLKINNRAWSLALIIGVG